MLSVVPLSRPLDPLWTSFILLFFFFLFWLQVLLVSFTPTYVFSYFWLKINSILPVSSCVTSFSLRLILTINSISVLLVWLPFCFFVLISFQSFFWLVAASDVVNVMQRHCSVMPLHTAGGGCALRPKSVQVFIPNKFSSGPVVSKMKSCVLTG